MRNIQKFVPQNLLERRSPPPARSFMRAYYHISCMDHLFSQLLHLSPPSLYTPSQPSVALNRIMSLPDNPPPQYSQSHSVPPKRSYGTAAEEPLLANHQASQDAWIHSSQNELADDEGDGFKDERNVTDCELEIRMGFVRKVYS